MTSHTCTTNTLQGTFVKKHLHNGQLHNGHMYNRAFYNRILVQQTVVQWTHVKPISCTTGHLFSVCCTNVRFPYVRLYNCPIVQIPFFHTSLVQVSIVHMPLYNCPLYNWASFIYPMAVLYMGSGHSYVSIVIADVLAPKRQQAIGCNCADSTRNMNRITLYIYVLI